MKTVLAHIDEDHTGTRNNISQTSVLGFELFNYFLEL